jgi:hypothetical protein
MAKFGDETTLASTRGFHRHRNGFIPLAGARTQKQ